MSQDTDFGRDVSDGVKDQLKAMNQSLAGETLHKPTDTDFSAAVARMKAAKCDLVAIGGIVRDTIQIISAIRKSGWDVETLGNIATYENTVAEVPGGVTEGYYTMTSVLLLDPADPKPEVQAFVKNYKAKFGREPNFPAQIGYSAAYLLVEGLKNAGTNLNLDSFITGMEAIKGYKDIFGSPPFTYGPKIRQGSNESFMVQVKGGKWVVAEGKPMGY
jgi:branched-chain amino acid transport system substrate-binding protein